MPLTTVAFPALRARAMLACCLTVGLLASMHADAAGPETPKPTPTPPQTLAEIIAATSNVDWEPLDPQNTLYLDLDVGRVIIKLAPDFAPEHIRNIKALSREHYYDGLAIVRTQDNYVVQMNDPDAEDPAKRRPIKHAQRTLQPEFSVATGDIPFIALPDADGYAPQTGFSHGFAAARDPAAGQTWLTHCYASVGVGRNNAADSGGGPELYVVIGSSPRQLDRNVTLIGRAVQGMELLSTLPRGTGPYSMYATPGERTAIKRVRLAADLPEHERTPLETLRTDTPSFAAVIELRRNPAGDWFKFQTGHVDVCNIPIPARPAAR